MPDLEVLAALVVLAAAVVLPVLAPATWKAMLPPKGPAPLLLTTFIRQKLLMPLAASVPVQVRPAGTLTENGWICGQYTARARQGEKITYCISADVGSTLLDSNGLKGSCHHALDHVALSVSDHVRSRRQLCALGVCASAGLVNHGEEVSALVVGCAVASDDSPCAGDGAGAVGGHLGQSVAGQGHGCLQIRHRELAVGGGLAEAILHRVVGVATKDGGVLLGLGILSEPGHDCTLDAKSGAVATLVATRCAKSQYAWIE